ncbi:hypothetical protein [Luteococcus japonicus]|uniref:Uncharacterized protein n=1 Tax=Luteococcus japonicus LSP_Lj1 TaxID=1255658 RepID=A0A1R4K542_9ACTN|nr:hypothetical protein [Luteococcus japonicus]SJN39366.1 hypothetical protein FM114_11495 [Luteococcus japonicus LSP_Lj1]
MLAQHLLDASRNSYRPDETHNAYSLVVTLTDLGVTGLPDVKRLTVLQAATKDPEPVLDDVLNATDADIQRHLEAHALWTLRHGTSRDGWNVSAHQEASRALVKRAQQQAHAILTDHADAIVAQLNTLWAPHVTIARDLVAAGIRPTDGAEQLLNHPADIQAMWREFRSIGAPALTRFAEARVRMSQELHVAPYNDGALTLTRPIDYAVALTDPWIRDAFNPRIHQAETELATWLRLATNLTMRAPSTIGKIDALEAIGDDVEAIRAASALVNIEGN